MEQDREVRKETSVGRMWENNSKEKTLKKNHRKKRVIIGNMW